MTTSREPTDIVRVKGVDVPISYREGVARIHWGDKVFPLFIPSRGREALLLENPLVEVANLVVDKEEAESYAKSCEEAGRMPLSILTHDTFGCPRIRNTINARWYHPEDGEDFNFQVDDDFSGLHYIGSRKSRMHQEAGYLLDVIVHVGRAASEAGSGLFFIGGSIITVKERVTYNPFKLRNWCRTGFFGWINKDLKMDERLICIDDLDLTLQAIAVHKVLWEDTRWVRVHNDAKGRIRNMAYGDSIWVSDDLIRHEQVYLRRKWGKHVVHLNVRHWRAGAGYKIRITVPRVYEDTPAEWRDKHATLGELFYSRKMGTALIDDGKSE